jgi:hypothetical protein
LGTPTRAHVAPDGQRRVMTGSSLSLLSIIVILKRPLKSWSHETHPRWSLMTAGFGKLCTDR